jgi:undecaprenyl-phosphate 4-deoxy-4-formamido-L-arabinose transferase
MRKTMVSVVIPCFRSTDALNSICHELNLIFEESEQIELVLIADGDGSGTWSRIQKLHNIYPKLIRGYQLAKNVGQQRATLFSISKALGNEIITMDDDGQPDPKSIEPILSRLRTGQDVVYAVPIYDEHNFFRNMSSTLAKSFLRAMGVYIHAKNLSAFRGIKSEILPS